MQNSEDGDEVEIGMQNQYRRSKTCPIKEEFGGGQSRDESDSRAGKTLVIEGGVGLFG